MAKRGMGKRGGKRPPQRRPRRTASPREPRGAEQQDLFDNLRTALRSEDPIDLLALTSSLLQVTDPRNRDPLAPAGAPQPPALDELVASFTGVSYAETTAVLTAMRALAPDEVMGARIGRELAGRRHPLPSWLTALSGARIEPEVWFVTHVLGDGDDYLFGVVLPTGHQLSALVYVDHNLGGVVKDAFVVPAPLSELVDRIQQAFEDDGQSITRYDPATARAVVTLAIEDGSRTYPPLESDSWPMCRPLVEWMLRMLPSGGSAPQRPEWSTADTEQLAEDFFTSSYGHDLDDTDHRGLLESVLWFGTDYGPGDPLRWSPVNVEILLLDWFPRKIIAAPAYLALLPDLLRAFIVYAHDRQGIAGELTEETLAALSEYAPQYQRLIRTQRPQGPAALIARMLESRIGPGHPDDLDDLTGFEGLGDFEDLGDFEAFGSAAFGGSEDLADLSEIVLDHLSQAVGGAAELARLDAKPLPDEPFGWDGVADDIVPVVRAMVAACDRCADELLDVEHRTAMRRFLRRAALADPAIFRRKASPERGAAAVAWVICRANGSAGATGGLAVQELLAVFGIAKGGVSQRAEPLLRANGVFPSGFGYQPYLGTPDLLVSATRQEMIEQRERWSEA